ncbi:hypothetical protein [Corynebacterium flavescens]|uniref:hypothetical protein n=1 Tax=Corynebacterium flavescens TaxID=28028 RepID=UPI003FD1F225
MTTAHNHCSLITVHKGTAQFPTSFETSDSKTLLKLAPRMAVAPHVYAALSSSERMRLRALAAARSSYTAVLISKSAARVHGLWVIPRPREEIELALPGTNLPSRSRWKKGWRYRKTVLLSCEQIQGARCVSPARAVVDIARFHGLVDGLVAAESALRAGIERQELAQEITALGRVKNARIARAVIDAAADNSRSPLQSLCRALILAAGIPCTMRMHPSTEEHVLLCLNNWLYVVVDEQKKTPANIQTRGRKHQTLRIRSAELIAHPERVVRAIEQALFQTNRPRSLRTGERGSFPAG